MRYKGKSEFYESENYHKNIDNSIVYSIIVSTFFVCRP
jgi:hypothetical protein